MPSIQRTLILLSVFILAAATVDAAAQGAPTPPPTAVIASQGGVSVTLADVDAFAARMPEGTRPGFFNSPTRIEGVITNLLVQKQLAVEARKAGIQLEPDAAGAATPVTDEALANARMQHFRADLKIPDLDELAQERYVGHKEDYVAPGKLTVKHVLISTTSRSEAEARAIAETVEKEARAHPDQFDALIAKYSDDPAKSTSHGVLEQVGEKGRYVATFVKAAKALVRPGDISPVVRTPLGLHVIELVERMPDQQRSFDAVKTEILARLKSEFVEKAVKEHTDALRNLPMNADRALVASLRTRYGTVPAIPGQNPRAADGK